MSTPRCPTCHRAYWRFRGDWPPRGYCSQACWQGRNKRKVKSPPESPAVVLEDYKQHRLTVHATHDIVTWIDCEVCERFEERYAVSMYL